MAIMSVKISLLAISNRTSYTVRQRVIVDHTKGGLDVEGRTQTMAMYGFIPIGFINSWEKNRIDGPYSY